MKRSESGEGKGAEWYGSMPVLNTAILGTLSTLSLLIICKRVYWIFAWATPSTSSPQINYSPRDVYNLSCCVTHARLRYAYVPMHVSIKENY